jgi:hypothetical protein
MGKLSGVLGGGGGLKNLAGETITIEGFDSEEHDNGREAVAILASNGDGKKVSPRTTSGVVIRQLYDLKAAELLPATVRVDERRSSSGRSYLSLSDPED